jgi:adenylate kinase
VIVLLGAPGAGKSTQGRLLSQATGAPYISSGDLARQFEHNQDALVVARGDLLPDEVIAELVFNRLQQPDAAHDAILDGFPRTLNQVRTLDDWLQAHGHPPPTVLYLDLPAIEARMRLGQRRQAEQRADDRTEAVSRRFAVFGDEMPKVIQQYERRGALRRIDASGGVDAVHSRVMAALAQNA